MRMPILCFLLFWQDPTRSMEEALMLDAAKTRAMQEERRREAEDDKRRLEQRFNRLVEAIQRFALEYNKARGDVWPLKQAEDLRSAYRDFEHSAFTKRGSGARSGAAVNAANSR